MSENCADYWSFFIPIGDLTEEKKLAFSMLQAAHIAKIPVSFGYKLPVSPSGRCEITVVVQ